MEKISDKKLFMIETQDSRQLAVINESWDEEKGETAYTCQNPDGTLCTIFDHEVENFYWIEQRRRFVSNIRPLRTFAPISSDMARRMPALARRAYGMEVSQPRQRPQRIVVKYVPQPQPQYRPSSVRRVIGGLGRGLTAAGRYLAKSNRKSKKKWYNWVGH